MDAAVCSVALYVCKSVDMFVCACVCMYVFASVCLFESVRAYVRHLVSYCVVLHFCFRSVSVTFRYLALLHVRFSLILARLRKG